MQAITFLSNARFALSGFLRSDTKWLEITSTAFLIVWSLLMISPMDVLSSAKAYQVLSYLGEGFIGSFGTLISTVSIYGLANHNRNVRRLGLLLSQYYWITFAICCLAASFETAGGWIYLMLAALCSFGYIYGQQDS